MGTTAPVASTGPPRDHRPEAKIPVVRALGLPVVRPDVPHAPRRRRCVGGLHPLAAPGAFPVPFRLARRDAEQTAAAYLKESGRLTGPPTSTRGATKIETGKAAISTDQTKIARTVESSQPSR